MKLLGKWNWYLPSWLNWIPQISHEPTVVSDDTRTPPRPTSETVPVLQPVGCPELGLESVA
jgi:RND superfamily putative drug exporter